MSAKELKELLEHIEDTGELVFRPARLRGGELVGELLDAWRAAAADAGCALETWNAAPGAEAYIVYRAAEDRADAAAAALAAAAREPQAAA